MTVTVLNNQSLLDITIQATGKAENLIKIAMANNLVPSDLIAPGTILTIPEEIEKDEQIVNYYKANNIQSATALTEEQTENIELTFWQKVIKTLQG